MANKKLIEDLKSLTEYPDQYILESYVAGIAARALEEIEYLQNQLDYQIECRVSDSSWANFKPGEMK